MPPKERPDASTSSLSNEKINLPTFLKLLTSNSGLSMPDAMAVAGKIFKTYNTPAQLSQLTNLELVKLKVDDKDQRKHVLAALRKAGYITTTTTRAPAEPVKVPGASKSPKKRKRDYDLDEDLPTSPPNEGVQYGSLDFHEITDEEVLMPKVVMVNRAPVMTAWATVVAERLGFKREEALSIASVYTEMNAASKGISLGIFDEAKNKDYVAGSAQPYVELMGRNPVLSTEAEEWRGIVKGGAALPGSAYGYIQRAFRQTMGSVIGSMRLLAETYSPAELNRKGFGLYAEFRPDSAGWGKHAEMKMENILALRKAVPEAAVEGGDTSGLIKILDEEPESKRLKDDSEEIINGEDDSF